MNENLDVILEKILKRFDFDKATTFLNNNDINISKEELKSVATRLITNLHEDKNNKYESITASHLIATREYIKEENIISYNLLLDVGVNAGFNVELDENISNDLNLNDVLLDDIQNIAESYGMNTNDYLCHLMISNIKEEKERLDKFKQKKLIDEAFAASDNNC